MPCLLARNTTSVMNPFAKYIYNQFFHSENKTGPANQFFVGVDQHTV